MSCISFEFHSPDTAETNNAILFSFLPVYHSPIHYVTDLTIMFKQVAGHRDFKAIAIASDIKPGATPCGMCRQLYVVLSPHHPDITFFLTFSLYRFDSDSMS